MAEEHEFDIMAGATASPAEPSRPPRSRRTPRARGTHRRRRLWTGPVLWVCCAAALVLAGVVVVPHEQGPVGPWGQVEDVTTAPQPSWTYQAIPTMTGAMVTGNVLVITAKESVTALDIATGDKLWTRDLADAACTTDSQTLVCADGSQVIELDPTTGASTWHQQVDDAVLATRAHGDLFVLRHTYYAKGSDQLERRSGGRVLWSTPVLINDFDVTDGHGLAVIGGYVLTNRASPKARSQQVSSGVFDAVNGKERGTEDPTYRLAHVAAGVWGEVTAEETHLYIRGNYQPVTLPGGNTLLYYDDDSSSDLTPRYIGNQDERPAGTGVFDTATGRWLWRDPDLTSPVLRLDGALMGLSIRSPEEQQLLARAVETGRVLWSKEHTALRCPCLADEHSVIAFYGEMSKDDQGFIHVEEWDLVGLEARTGQLLWRVAPPKFSSSLLTDGEYIVAVSEMGMRAWKLGAGKAKSA